MGLEAADATEDGFRNSPKTGNNGAGSDDHEVNEGAYNIPEDEPEAATVMDIDSDKDLPAPSDLIDREASVSSIMLLG